MVARLILVVDLVEVVLGASILDVISDRPSLKPEVNFMSQKLEVKFLLVEFL